MRKVAAITATLALGFMSTVALASGWSDFSASFPVSPCQDGWVGCVVDGDAISPEMTSRGGVPTPADLRVSWFDLEGTPAFSPFPGLSEYTGELAGAEPDPDPEPVNDAVVDADPEPAPERPERPSNGGGGSADPDPEPAPKPDRPAMGTGGGGGTPVAPRPDAVSISQIDQGTPEPTNAIISDALKDKPVSTVADGDCSNIKKLEPMAMLGKLSPEQTKCLEGELAAAPKQTDKDKISRVLMTNAWSANDKKSWEQLVKRHLDEIDRSDPDICYKYALHLSKKGAGSSSAVIQWSDVALENKTIWTGSTYTNRVNSLYKLRAAAAQTMWQAAENKYGTDASDANRASRDNARNKTKVLAREWYEYAKSAGKDADKARALCVTAAGTEDYCEGA